MSAQGPENGRNTLLVPEKEHLRLANVILQESLNIELRDLNDLRLDVLSAHFLELVGRELLMLVVERRHGEGRVHADRRELSNALLLADFGPFFAVDGADAVHGLDVVREQLEFGRNGNRLGVWFKKPR